MRIPPDADRETKTCNRRVIFRAASFCGSEEVFGGPISFDHNDSNENPYDLILQGTVSDGTPPPVVQIIDDGDAGYSATAMVDYVLGGYLGDLDYAAAGTGTSQATWSFPVISGRYRVSATWVEYQNRAIDAPYTIFDGTAEVAQVDVNQKVAPSDFSAAGANWEDLAIVDVSGSTLNVTLTNDASEFVIADAVRIERIGNVGSALMLVDAAFASLAEPAGNEAVVQTEETINDDPAVNTGFETEADESLLEVLAADQVTGVV